MNHAEFDWDFENISHIARHGVTPEEAEEVLSRLTLEVGARELSGETRYSEVGSTLRGRILFVAWTLRGEKVRVVTSLEPSATLKKQFLASKGAF